MIAGFDNLSYYEILDVSIGMEAKEIQEGYYRIREIFAKNSLASYSLFTPEEREEILGIIEDAYHTLIDEKDREEYDRRLQEERIRLIKAGQAEQEMLPLMPMEAGGDKGGMEQPATSPESKEPLGQPAEPSEGTGEAEEEIEEVGADYFSENERPAAMDAEQRETMEGVNTLLKAADAKEDAVLEPGEQKEPEGAQAKPAPFGPAEKVGPKGRALAETGADPAGHGAEIQKPISERELHDAIEAQLEKGDRVKAMFEMEDGADSAAGSEGPAEPASPALKTGPGTRPEPEQKPLLSAGEKTGEQRPRPAKDATPEPLTKRTRADIKDLRPDDPAKGGERFEDTVMDIPPPEKSATALDYIASGVSGQLLKKAREAKGLSLEEVWSTTKIRKPILQAIEDEQYGKLPANVFLKGMLRTYARLLELEDPEAVVKRYMDRVITAREWMD
jgi:hypothetical protein